MVKLKWLENEEVYALYIDGARKKSFTKEEAPVVIKLLQTLQTHNALNSEIDH